MSDLTPPNAQESEQIVLGSILRNSACLPVVQEILTSESDFYSPRHWAVYRSILALSQRGEAVDIVTVANELQNTGEIDKVTRLYLSTLSECAEYQGGLESHAKIVQRKATARKLIGLCTEAQRSAYQEDTEIDGVLDDTQRGISELMGFSSGQSQTLLGALDKLILDLEKPKAQQAVLPTPFADLDKLVGGFYPGEYIIFAGRTSVGKSSAAIQVCMDLAERGHGVMYYPLDHRGEDMARRVVTIHTGVSRRDMMPEHAKAARERYADMLSRFYFRTPKTRLVGEFKNEVRRRVRQDRIRLVVVDHVGQFDGKGKSRYEAVTNVSHELKAIGIETETPIIVVCQLRRDWQSGTLNPAKGKYPRPKLSDLKDTGELENDANTVILFHSESAMIEAGEGKLSEAYREYERKYVSNGHYPVEIIVAKQKDGPTGTVSYFYNKERMTFVGGLSDRKEPEVYGQDI